MFTYEISLTASKRFAQIAYLRTDQVLMIGLLHFAVFLHLDVIVLSVS